MVQGGVLTWKIIQTLLWAMLGAMARLANQTGKQSQQYFWEAPHQICGECVVTLEIEGVAVAADAPGVHTPAAAPTPQQPPPPPHPPGNHAMQQRDIMETKVTVLEIRAEKSLPPLR